MFSEFTPDIEILTDRWEEEQAVLAGLAEINSIQDIFGFSFEEASQFALESAQAELAGLESAMSAIGDAVVTLFGLDAEDARNVMAEKLDSEVKSVRARLANLRSAIPA